MCLTHEQCFHKPTRSFLALRNNRFTHSPPLIRPMFENISSLSHPYLTHVYLLYAGVVQVGDEVHEVNGELLSGRRPAEVVRILTGALGPVTLRLAPAATEMAYSPETKVRNAPHHAVTELMFSSETMIRNAPTFSLGR